MAESIGKQLKQARLKRGLSLEDISHETKIPVSRLQDLEEDNYGSFPSPTYAKSFLSIYSDFVEVDASDFLEALKGPNSPLIAGRNYIPPSLDLDSDQTIPIFKSHEAPREGNPVFTLLFLVVLIVIIPTIYFIGKPRAQEAFGRNNDAGQEELAGGPTTVEAATDSTPVTPAEESDAPSGNSVAARPINPAPEVMAGEDGEDGDQFSRPLVPSLPDDSQAAPDPELDALIQAQRSRPSEAIVAQPVAPTPPEQAPEPEDPSVSGTTSAEGVTPPEGSGSSSAPRARRIGDSEDPQTTPQPQSQVDEEPVPRALPFRPNR